MHAAGERDFPQQPTGEEGISTYGFHILAKDNRCQRAVGESIVSNSGDAIGNGEVSQALTPRESIVPDSNDAVGNGHAAQLIAVGEGLAFNAADAVGEYHAVEAAAAIEDRKSTRLNSSHLGIS